MELFNKWYLGLMAVGLPLAVGCQTLPTSTVGWEVRITKPSLVTTAPATTTVTSGTSQGLVAIDQGTVVSEMRGGSLRGAVPVQKSMSGAGLPGVADPLWKDPCTCEEILRRLDVIERRLTVGPADRLPMPK